MIALNRVNLKSCLKTEFVLGWLTLFTWAAIPRACPQSPPQVTVQLSNGYARVSVVGDVGSDCTIQSATNLSQNWQFVTNFTLLSNQSLVLDPTSPLAAQRFYRVYSQEVPTNVVTTNMVWLSSGTFTMGSPDTEAERDSEEGPQTRVTISQGFWMGRYEVTQGEYSSLMSTNPSAFQGDLTLPVEQVSWNDAVAYCAALTMREQTAARLPAGYVYRLPTEAEWEYACRAGTTTAFHYGPALRSGMANFRGALEYDSSVGTIENPDGIDLSGTTSVGSYAPNPWGLYDMHGNLWEWCQDWWSASLPGGSVTDPAGPSTGPGRVFRGGSWFNIAFGCRSAIRAGSAPDLSDYRVGFRSVLSPGHP